MARIALLLFILLVPMFAQTATADMGSTKLPLRVRMVLVKIAPLLEKSNYDEAAEILVAFRNKQKDEDDLVYNHPQVVFALGNCFALTDRFQQARKLYREVVKRNPDHLTGWQNLATTEYELENYTDASKAFLRSYQLTLQLEKVEPKYLYYCAITLLMAEQYGSCLEKFDQLITRHPEAMTLEWKENLVHALLHDNKAIRALPYIIELTEGYSGKKQQRWQEILLQQYMTLDLYKKALVFADKLTRKHPTTPAWWKGLVHIHLHKGNYNKALAAMTIYSYLTEMSREEHKLLADLFLQQSIPRKAIAGYELNLKDEKEEKEEETIFALVRAYRAVDQNELALQKLDANKAHVASYKLFMERGEILYSIKKYPEAATAFSKAANHGGKVKGRALLMAGYCYWQLEQLKKASAAFLEAAKSKRYRSEAKKALKQLEKLSQVPAA